MGETELTMKRVSASLNPQFPYWRGLSDLSCCVLSLPKGNLITSIYFIGEKARYLWVELKAFIIIVRANDVDPMNYRHNITSGSITLSVIE